MLISHRISRYSMLRQAPTSGDPQDAPAGSSGKTMMPTGSSHLTSVPCPAKKKPAAKESASKNSKKLMSPAACSEDPKTNILNHQN